MRTLRINQLVLLKYVGLDNGILNGLICNCTGGPTGGYNKHVNSITSKADILPDSVQLRTTIVLQMQMLKSSLTVRRGTLLRRNGQLRLLIRWAGYAFSFRRQEDGSTGPEGNSIDVRQSNIMLQRPPRREVVRKSIREYDGF